MDGALCEQGLSAGSSTPLLQCRLYLMEVWGSAVTARHTWPKSDSGAGALLVAVSRSLPYAPAWGRLGLAGGVIGLGPKGAVRGYTRDVGV